MQSYTSRDNSGKAEQGHFLVSHKAEPPLQFRTGAEPIPVKNLKVIASSDNSIEIKWSLPEERGFKILG